MFFELRDDAPNGPADDGKGDEPTPEQVRAARRAAIERVSVDVSRGTPAAPSAPVVDAPAGDDAFDIDLTDVPAETAKAIRTALKEGKAAQQSAQTIAGFAMEQARRVAALEIQTELGLDADEVKEIERALQSATRPDQLDLTRRELVIKLKTDGTFAPPAKPADKKKGGDAPSGDKRDTRTFDTGRSSGNNEVAVLMKKIDEIDASKPGAMDELEKLRGEVEAAQKRFTERASRGR